MSPEDRPSDEQGAHSGQNRVMKMLGIGVIVLLAIFILMLATGLGDMAPWDGGDGTIEQ